MTQVGRLFLEEMQQGIEQAVGAERLRTEEDIAENMLREGDSTEKIVRCTGLSAERIEELREAVLV